jgi:hypothetical protein
VVGAFEFVPRRLRVEARRELVRLLGAHYSALHSLHGPPDHRLPIGAIETMEELDDILVF